MTRHDTAQQTTDSSSSQHNLTHDTTRRDATASMIHVCAGWQVRHLHAAMQDHRNTAVLSVGLGKNGRPGTGDREWSSVVGSGHWALVVSLPSAGVLLLRRWSMASTPGTSHSPNSSKCHPPSLATVTFRPAPPLACLSLVNLDRAERPQAHPVRSVANESENLLTYWC